MRGRIVILQWVCVATGLMFLADSSGFAQTSTNQTTNPGLRMKVVKGKVEYMRSGAQVWETNTIPLVDIPLYIFDRVRTPELSQLSVIFSDNSVVTFDERSEFIVQPVAGKARSRFRLIEGFLSFFHRDQPADLEVETQVALAVVRGTEFALQVTADNRTIVTVFDGVVDLSNREGQSIELKNREEGEVEAGKAPVKRAALDAVNVIQWILYYPGILDDRELDLRADERSALNESLAAYRSGDVLNALYKYPIGRKPDSDAERIYLAAIYLAVGKVSSAEELFGALPRGVENNPVDRRNQALAAALKEMIAAVKLQKFEQRNPPELATEWLAESYYLQSQRNLGKALEAARIAATHSPEFGFAWTRVAELEFGFGRTSQTREALENALRFSPRNAQTVALKGFILASENKIKSAITTFDEAIALDPGLGNAWLGRGLCRIRRGDSNGGREDLLIAAAAERQRGFLRSYLGKAYANEGDLIRAEKELDLAKRLDPRDPTAWLYSALLKQQKSQINEAVRELEYSQDLNTNRNVYRSEFLLDQDRAVRSANLAHIYRDAGLEEVSQREAARAVSYDYGNYSAHLFLADSYRELRDPKLVNLRYETPLVNEYLLANLLAPAAAGPLSSTISQQEYSKLLEGKRLGVVSSTEYLSSGDWVQEGAQYGNFGDFSYSVEAFYRSENGQRPNNDLEQRQLSLLLKQQLTPKDSLFVEVGDTRITGGDLFQYYDQNNANPDLRTKEEQEPFGIFGYHREWSPGNQTLLLAAYIDDSYTLTNTAWPAILQATDMGQLLAVLGGTTLHEDFQIAQKVFTAEAQQIWQQHNHNTILGARFQYSEMDVSNLENIPSANAAYFDDPAALQNESTFFRRLAFYGYHYWHIHESLQLIGGVSYDRISFPKNFRSPPISPDEEEIDQVSPKAGLIWEPMERTRVQFAYTRSLAGASLDQSFQLEPSQVAGFIQSYRSIMPEAVAGAEAGARFETFGLSLEKQFFHGTYFSLSGEILNSDARRSVGVFDVRTDLPFAVPATLREDLNYREKSASLTLNQLIGDWISTGARYRISQADIASDFFDVSNDIALDFIPRQEVRGVLHQVNLFGLLNHPSGVFARLEGSWYKQDNSGYEPNIPGDKFWQFNAFLGYRFPRRNAELLVGLLNVFDQDYKLNPLNLYNELPRERTLMARLRLNF
jgi:Tfp pilus assembly protein PilF